MCVGIIDKRVLLVIGASSDVGNAYVEKYESNYNVIIAHYHSLADKLLSLKNRIGDKLKLYQADFLDKISTREFINKVREGNCHTDLCFTFNCSEGCE